MGITVKRAERKYEIATDLTMLDRVDELTKIIQADSATLADPAKTKAARELKKLEKALDDSTLVITFRAVSAREYAEALSQAQVEKDSQHPDGIDWYRMVQLLAPDATVEARWKTGEAAEFNPDMDWPGLLDSMSDFQVAGLLSVIIGLGRETGAGPKAAFERASRTLQKSAKN